MPAAAAAASCLLEILIASSPKLQHLTLSWCQMTLSGGYGGYSPTGATSVSTVLRDTSKARIPKVKAIACIYVKRGISNKLLTALFNGHGIHTI